MQAMSLIVSSILLASAGFQSEHVVKTPTLEMAGVSVRLRMPLNWDLTTEAKSKSWNYRALSAEIVSSRSKRTELRLDFLVWSTTRCVKLGRIRGKPVPLSKGLKGYWFRFQNELWFCVPLKHHDIAVCLVARYFASPEIRSQYRHMLSNLELVEEPE